MAKWERAQIFGKANQGKIPFNKETEATVNGVLTGVGKPKTLSTGDNVIVLAIQPKVKIGEEYKYTFSVNKNSPQDKQDDYRSKMTERGYVEKAPVFVRVKYKPEAVQMYEMLSEMVKYDRDSGKKSFNAIDVRYSVITEKKDGQPMKTETGREITNNYAAVAWMSYPPEREAEFKEITGKYMFVELGKNAPVQEAPVQEAAVHASPAAKAEENLDSFAPEIDMGDDADIPF